MALSQTLVQKQAQTLTLSNQLRQAIELLELSHLDLQAYCEQATLENPFLEIETNRDSLEKPADQEETEPKPQDSRYETLRSEDYDNIWTSDISSPPKKFHTDDRYHGLDNIAAETISLRDHIQSQINTDIKDEKDRLIAMTLLNYLHETGYLLTPLTIIAENLNTTIPRLEKILKKLQQFDPCGVFARSLRECLMLQLKEQGFLHHNTKLILEHIDLYAQARIDELLKKTHCTHAELKEALEHIKLMDPKPGLKFSNHHIVARIPDVFVTRNLPTNEWVVSMNPEVLPKVLVTQNYKLKMAIDCKNNKELRKYYQERMASANWLVRALDQRAKNILKVVQEIVSSQTLFFEKGIEYLSPMRLKDVALAIGVHESTVSRITQNKYLSCPRGMFELRYFFSSSIPNAWTGEDQSALKIQHHIQQLIKQEDPKKPFSDDAIVRHLSTVNIDVARRTVTKYRELLAIPSSYERKRHYLRTIIDEEC